MIYKTSNLFYRVPLRELPFDIYRVGVNRMNKFVLHFFFIFHPTKSCLKVLILSFLYSFLSCFFFPSLPPPKIKWSLPKESYLEETRLVYSIISRVTLIGFKLHRVHAIVVGRFIRFIKHFQVSATKESALLGWHVIYLLPSISEK